MKVKLLVDWAGRKAGEVMELTDTKAKRVIGSGLVERVKVAKKSKPKADKPKEYNDVRTKETIGK